MNKNAKFVFVLGLLLTFNQSFAAFDTLSNVIRPRIGIGTGTFTYFGEIQNYQKKFSPIVNRYGAIVYVNAPISRMFNLEFSANYGKFAANERTLSRNFNFESRVRMGTVYLRRKGKGLRAVSAAGREQTRTAGRGAGHRGFGGAARQSA